MTSKTKKIIKWVVGLGILGALVGLLFVFVIAKTQWYRDFSAEEGGKITAVELVKAYQTNAAKADSLYSGSQGKFLEVEGEVASVLQEGETTIINLKSGDEMVMVSCSLKAKNTSITTGQKLIIKGKCNGINMDVELNEAEVLSLPQ